MTNEPARQDAAPTRNEPPDAASAVSHARRGDDFDRDVWCVLGLPVDAISLSGAALEVETAVRDGCRLSFVTPNVNWLVGFMKDPEARRRVVDADLSLADGAPLVLLARLLGAPIRSRAAGSDLFDLLRKRSGIQGRRLRVFFFGGRESAAEAAAKALNAEHGGLESAGWLNPGYGDVASLSAPSVIDKINDARPDFVLVALGADKGQAWIDLNQSRIAAPVIAHLGAVLDFVAGGVRRAPAWMRSVGLEWAWRIKEEPALWRRYFSDGCSFLGLLAMRLPSLLMTAPRRATGNGRAETRLTPTGSDITLEGVLIKDTLAPVREAFRAAARRGGKARLIFKAVQAFDPAFLGMVLMLEKHLVRSAGEIVLQGISSSQHTIFRANAMTYAVEEAQEAMVGAVGRVAAN